MVRPEHGSDYSRLFSSGYYGKSDEKEILARKLVEYFKDDTFKDVLDIGPGDGRITRVLAERGKHITAVEVEEGYKNSFRKNFPKARLIEKPIQEVTFSPKSFDLVMLSHVLYYLPISQWLTEMARFHDWVRPGGRLICILNTPDCEWWDYYYELAGRLKVVPGFSYTDSRAFFKECPGEVSEVIEYDSRLVWQGDRKGLIEFILAIILALPLSMVNDHNSRIVNDFIDEHTAKDGSFSIGERAAIGVWRK